MANGNPSAVAVAPAGRPQPQTTGEAPGGPFIRHAPPGRRPVYQQSPVFGQYFGPKMVAAPGWYRGYRLEMGAAGAGTGGVLSTTNPAGVDYPFSVVQQLQLKDAYGTNLLAGPGWEMLFLMQLLSGEFGIEETRDIRNLPSNVGVTAAPGTFNWSSYLPFEFTTGYGVIAAANAALLPDLQMPIQASSAIFSTAPSALPTLTATLDADFYWLPNVPIDPPGIGTTMQCIFQPCNPPIPSNGQLRVQLPRLGGYLAYLGFDLRDSTGLRVDAFPARPGIFVDSVELINSSLDSIKDDMAIGFGIGGNTGTSPTQTTFSAAASVPRPTGIIAISRKTSLSQRDMGLLDTGEKFLSTNPGTQIEINGVPWGSITNAPGNLNAVIGQVVPSGPLLQGLPEV